MDTQTKKVAPTPDEGFADGDAVPASFADSLGDCFDGAEYETGFYLTAFPLDLIGRWRFQGPEDSWGQVHPNGECIDPVEGYCGNSEGCLINSYVEAMERGDAFPSIEVVYNPASTHRSYAPWLVEGGYHRNTAWRIAGFTHAPALIFANSAEELAQAKALLLG